MSPRVVRRAAVVIAVALVAAAGILAWRWTSTPTPLVRALDLVPAEVARATWTDWEAVRAELGSNVDAGSPADDVEAFVTESFDRDLSSMSALGTSAGVMQETLGFSPAGASWELLAQSPEGAVLVLGADGLDLDDIAGRLAELGWTEPDDPDGVWKGGPDVLASAGPTLTPELQHIALLKDRGLILASDQEAYLEQTLEVVDGDAESAAATDDDLAEAATALGEPVAAAAYTGAYACEHLAMAQADDADRAEADQLIEAAGGVHPLTAFAMGTVAGGNVRAVLQVEDPDDAAADAQARAELAGGPAPGQGGDFSDRFSIEAAAAEGREIVLDLRPELQTYVLSDLTSGPVLFATC